MSCFSDLFSECSLESTLWISHVCCIVLVKSRDLKSLNIPKTQLYIIYAACTVISGFILPPLCSFLCGALHLPQQPEEESRVAGRFGWAMAAVPGTCDETVAENASFCARAAGRLAIPFPPHNQICTVPYLAKFSLFSGTKAMMGIEKKKTMPAVHV